MLDCRSSDTPMDPNVKLLQSQKEPLEDPRKYHCLVGRLNYLTITRPIITFAVDVLSQFMKDLTDSHCNVAMCMLQSCLLLCC